MGWGREWESECCAGYASRLGVRMGKWDNDFLARDNDGEIALVYSSDRRHG